MLFFVGIFVVIASVLGGYVALGGKLFVLHGPDGVRLVPYDPEFADTIEDARKFMREYRDTLRELAK